MSQSVVADLARVSLMSTSLTDYRLLIAWDPIQNQDVGWFALRRGVLLPQLWDENRFQLRDFNTNTIEPIESASEDQVTTNQAACSETSTDLGFQLRDFNTSATMEPIYTKSASEEDDQVNTVFSETSTYLNDINGNISEKTKNEGIEVEGISDEEVDVAYSTINISDDTQTNLSEVEGGDECPICSKRFIQLHRHIRTVHKIYNMSGYMSECGKCKMKVFNAEGHKFKCTGTDPEKPLFSCPVCNLTLQKKSWPDHAKNMHGMEKRKCFKCNRNVYYNYTDHYQKCRGKSEINSRITCPVCSGSYVRKHFAKHVRIVHKMKKQKCPQCLRLVYLLEDHLPVCQSNKTKVQLPASAAEPMCEYERLREQRIMEIKEEFRRLGLQKDVKELKERKDDPKKNKTTGKNCSTAKVPINEIRRSLRCAKFASPV